MSPSACDLLNKAEEVCKIAGLSMWSAILVEALLHEPDKYKLRRRVQKIKGELKSLALELPAPLESRAVAALKMQT